MITTEFYEGQGLGNQLWSYSAVRAVARRLGFDYGFQSINKFKGLGLFALDFGKKVYGISSSAPGLKPNTACRYWYKETTVLHPADKGDITPIDKSLFLVKDKTKIDGYFQSEELILPLRVELTANLQIPQFHNLRRDRCVINLRGGEYVHHKNLFLGFDYYRNAINNLLEINPKIDFAVVTDDLYLAKEFFPHYPILSTHSRNYDIKGREKFDQFKAAVDFGLIQSAEYLILSNSSFSWWGAWSNLNTKVVIAPKYWARFNQSDGYWSLGDSLTRNWLWQDRLGKLWEFKECLAEYKEFKLSLGLRHGE